MHILQREFMNWDTPRRKDVLPSPRMSGWGMIEGVHALEGKSNLRLLQAETKIPSRPLSCLPASTA